MAQTGTNEYSENTTREDLLAEFKNDRIVSGVLQMIAVKAGQNREELRQDFAVLLSARMNHVWGKTMDEDEAEMEGIEAVSEQDLKDLLRKFQLKYKLTDEYVEHIQKACQEYINENTVSRGVGGSSFGFSFGNNGNNNNNNNNNGNNNNNNNNCDSSGLDRIKKQYFFLKIVFLPVTAGIKLFGTMYDPKTGYNGFHGSDGRAAGETGFGAMGGGGGGEDYGIKEGINEAGAGASSAFSGFGDFMGDCLMQ